MSNQNNQVPQEETKKPGIITDALEDNRRSQQLPFRKSPTFAKRSPIGGRFNRMSADASRILDRHRGSAYER